MMYLRHMTDYQRARQFPPSKIVTLIIWIMAGATVVCATSGLLGILATFDLALGWSR